MPTPLPLACTLDRDQLSVRLDEIRDVGRRALRTKTATGTRAVLAFDPAPGIHERLAAIVAAEAKCCAFLTMTLDEHPDAITLTIDAPADARPVLEGLLASFELSPAPRPSPKPFDD